MTRDEWTELCIERGTRGEFVFDIIRDWTAEVERWRKDRDERAVQKGELLEALQNKTDLLATLRRRTPRIREALSDPLAPWYGSDLVTLVGNLCDSLEQ